MWSPENKRALVVRVNNAGPYWGNRTLDLSRAAAEKLGFEGEGVAKLKVRVIKAPEEAETKYVENRDYDPVPGDIGQYASLDDAQRGMAVVLAFKATTGSPFAPVTTANAFKGQAIGSDMLVAEAPQAMGRSSVTLGRRTPASRSPSVASRRRAAPISTRRSRGRAAGRHQTPWDEDRVIDEPAKVVASVTEKSSITEKAAEPEPRKIGGGPRGPQARKSPNAEAGRCGSMKMKSRKTKKVARKSDRRRRQQEQEESCSQERRRRGQVRASPFASRGCQLRGASQLPRRA